MTSRMKYILTSDVECFSFATSSFDEGVACEIEDRALPRMLDLLVRYDIVSTFFFTGRFAELSPRSVRMVMRSGHEVACHGYDHNDYYDRMDYQKQLDLLKKSRSIIEEVSGTEVLSFRAPALRINKDTVKALEAAGFRYDSSVASQRFDGPLTSGAKRKLGWLIAPREPYYLSYDNPFRRGNSSVLEVPISAFLWPLIGTHMRLSYILTAQINKLLMSEARFNGRPIVFLFHPNECLEYKKIRTIRRNNWFSDELRHVLKMRNLGSRSLNFLELLIRDARHRGFDFVAIRDYGNGV